MRTTFFNFLSMPCSNSCPTAKWRPQLYFWWVTSLPSHLLPFPNNDFNFTILFCFYKILFHFSIS